MTVFAYRCRGSNLTAGVWLGPKGKSSLLDDAANEAGLAIDKMLKDSRKLAMRRLIERPKGFALDQQLTAGDAVILSLGEFSKTSERSDVLHDWHRRGVRIVLVECPTAPAEHVNVLISGLATFLDHLRRERCAAKM
jgi:hypothetical protein